VTAIPVPTPHISAPPGAFAETVLLPGDPLRARFIAERFFDDAVQVTAVRGMLGYTGHYRGRRLSVMGSGIGMPSCCLYATELVRGYGVRRVLRVGTCGAVDERLALGDIVLALGAGTDANCNRQRFAGYDLPATASWALLQRLASVAQSRHIQLFVGNVFSSDQFYGGAPSLLALLQAQKILAIEMEAAGLYAVAAEHGVEAAALLTVTDHLPSGAGWPSERREQDLLPMLGLALDALLEC
jgi:purine-nucleoside phosphorylase